MVDEPNMDAILDKIAKLLSLAAKNTNENEATSAAAKAQELLTRYNLDVAAVERTQGRTSGKREEAKVTGGFYNYQQRLWRTVAHINFCLHWVQTFKDVRDKTIVRRGRTYVKGDIVWKKQHRIVGRQVNVATTKTMAAYLEDAIDRALREKLGGDNLEQLYGKWGISFREGCVHRIVERLNERHRARLSEEEKKSMAQDRAAMGDRPVGDQAITLVSYQKSEEDANYDYIYGEGTSARWKQQNAEAAAKRAAEAAEYTAWAAANPEKARREEEERKAEEEKAAKRRRSSGGRAYRGDHRAWWAGHDAGDKVGLDLQTESRADLKIGGAKWATKTNT